MVGSSYVVDHQRISGLGILRHDLCIIRSFEGNEMICFVFSGYCFSASLPPMLAGAGLHALNLIKENPHFITELQANCYYLHDVLSNVQGFILTGHELSPLKFLSLSDPTGSRQTDQKVLDQVILFVSINLCSFIRMENPLNQMVNSRLGKASFSNRPNATCTFGKRRVSPPDSIHSHFSQ